MSSTEATIIPSILFGLAMLLWDCSLFGSLLISSACVTSDATPEVCLSFPSASSTTCLVYGMPIFSAFCGMSATVLKKTKFRMGLSFGINLLLPWCTRLQGVHVLCYIRHYTTIYVFVEVTQGWCQRWLFCCCGIFSSLGSVSLRMKNNRIGNSWLIVSLAARLLRLYSRMSVAIFSVGSPRMCAIHCTHFVDYLANWKSPWQSSLSWNEVSPCTKKSEMGAVEFLLCAPSIWMVAPQRKVDLHLLHTVPWWLVFQLGLSVIAWR